MRLRHMYIFDEIQALETIFLAAHFGKLDCTDRISNSLSLSSSYGNEFCIDDLIKAFHKLKEGK